VAADIVEAAGAVVALSVADAAAVVAVADAAEAPPWQSETRGSGTDCMEPAASA
jgi:hypothetical protein